MNISAGIPPGRGPLFPVFVCVMLSLSFFRGEITFKEIDVRVVGDADLWCFCIISAKQHFRDSLPCVSSHERVLQEVWRQERSCGVTC